MEMVRRFLLVLLMLFLMSPCGAEQYSKPGLASIDYAEPIAEPDWKKAKHDQLMRDHPGLEEWLQREREAELLNMQLEHKELTPIVQSIGILLITIVVLTFLIYRLVGKKAHPSRQPLRVTVAAIFWLSVPILIFLPIMYLFNKFVTPFDGNVWITLGFAAAIIRAYMSIWKFVKERSQSPAKRAFFKRRTAQAFLSGSALWWALVAMVVYVFEPFGRFDGEAFIKTLIIAIGTPLIFVLTKAWYTSFGKK